MIKEFQRVSPMKLISSSKPGGLGRGNLGVLIARAGVGKTACLIHIAFDKLFQKDKLAHVSLDDIPEKVTSYYNVIFSDLVKALDIQDDEEAKLLFERNRMILAYLNQSFDIGRLSENLKNLSEKIEFRPDTIIVDGLDFEKADRTLFDGFKRVAKDFDTEIWLSALSHRHITQTNERGIPYPCNQIDDAFTIIIQLAPTSSGVFLKVLKNHDEMVSSDDTIRLDPNTYLAME